MKTTDFSVSIEFTDGVKVTLGGDDELFVEPDEGSTSALLNDDRLNLVRLVRQAEREACLEA